ncbi:hypothetical protein GWK41_05405 [Persephonella atlantica]|uniref:Flagellar protein FlgN n=1 Tax=Persephonella atlantica TaxID=2699429 RepID=A0ABS1GHT6_9AQUI|nr:hypothetical protein [Persephonella atlantica]MBK3332498.1 hypothetical protein [Persephonella atlantica]
MENLESLVEQLIEKLKEEKECLIFSIKDSSYCDKLVEVVEEKRKLLSKISRYNKKDFEGLEEKLQEIKRLSDINLNLAVNNAQFIDELFGAIFEEPQKYDQSGAVKQNQKGLFNKKI